MVPLVQRLRGVQPLVALQPDQLTVQHTRQYLRDLRLADARLALQDQRPPQRQRQVDGGEQPFVGEVLLAGELLPELLRSRATAQLVQPAQHALGRERHLGQPHAAGIVDGVRDRRDRRVGGHLADALGAERTARRRAAR